MQTEKEVIDRFTYHTPTLEQTARMENIRELTRQLALAIFQNVNCNADRTAAIRLLHQAQMTANTGIILEK